jgi:hypothetical protein
VKNATPLPTIEDTQKSIIIMDIIIINGDIKAAVFSVPVASSVQEVSSAVKR